ncbi:MAG: hypothetical protein ACYDAR_09310 [Thermomicrobiales bacterium]
MAAQRHDAMIEVEDGLAQDERAKRLTLKRRGILAAAGAVVAGIVAKQTAQPVAAGTDGDVILGNGLFDTTKNVASAATRITSTGSAGAAFRAWGTNGDRGMEAISDNSAALLATTEGGNSPDSRAVIVTQNNAGDRGIGVDVVINYSVNGIGLKGTVLSSGGVGAQGQCDKPFGVGVFGESSSYYGVHGTTKTGIGVVGEATPGGNGTSNIGVYGLSATGIGVYGTTGGTGLVAGVYGTSTTAYGIIGSTTASGYSGLTAITSTAGVAALAATSLNASAYAAYFSGKTVVEGDFYVVKHADGTGGGKFAAVPGRDGRFVGMYATEAPEPWFEDFGEGKMVNGKAEVTIDPEFAALIHTDTYHVFVTPHDDTNGLHVTNRRAGSFSVTEHKGGTSSLRFSWRVVAKRKDIKGERLPKVTLPKINTPDPNKLPKPEPPKKP